MQYTVSYTVEKWRRVVVEADSEEQAREKFWAGDFDHEEVEEFGAEIQEGVDVEEATA
jgi:hypothetical protein